jgi:hypothetical protein
MSPNAGEGGVAGYQPFGIAVHWSTNKLVRSSSIFNLSYRVQDMIKENDVYYYWVINNLINTWR